MEFITYHGSHINFDKFEYNPRGIYFCDKENAIQYALVKYNRYKDYL